MLEKRTQIAYYPEGVTLINRGDIPQKMFVIIKGRVEAYHEDEVADIYNSYDVFGGIELLKKQPSAERYDVCEELICHEIPSETFLELCDSYPQFRDYFFASLVERVELLKEKREYASISDLMLARLDRDLLQPACIIDATTPIKEALVKMEEMNASSILVNNPNGYGIVTDTNLRRYILRQETDDLVSIKDIQTFPIIWAKDGELLFNILLLMTKKSIKHLPIFDDYGSIVGLLEMINLVSFFANQTHLITGQMENAKSLQEIILAASRVEIMIGSLHAKGVKSRYIAKLVTEINKKMYAKLFKLIIPPSWQDKCAFVLLGSEGRREQILRTDQDNAIVFEAGFHPADIERVTLEFVEALDKIGFPRCEGNVMVINPKWHQDVTGYKKMIDAWISNPTQENLMDVAIFFDSWVVAGNEKLHVDLRDYLVKQIQDSQLVIRHFAKPIESFDSALGIFSQFVTENKAHKHEIDIKKTALFPIVHGIRSLALEKGIMVTNTYGRIKELNNSGFMSRDDAHAMIEALEVINTLRLHSQIAQQHKGQKPNNYVAVNSLGKMERDLLKEALKSVERFKKVVGYHFHLSMVQ